METINNLKNKIELAMRFSDLLRLEVGDYNIALINKLNNEADDDSCASHEIMDANCVMHDAFVICFEREMDLQSSDINLINDAWTIAKASDFFVSRTNVIFVL